MKDVDFVISKLDAIRSEYAAVDFNDLPDPIKTFCLTSEFKAMVDNGGLLGFLINPSGDQADATLESLDTMGFVDIREKLESAISLFPGDILPASLDDRNDAIDGRDDLDAAWDELDNKFYAAGESIDAALRRWASVHEDVFPGGPQSAA